MHTRSSSNLPVVSPLNPSTSNSKRRNRRRSKQPFILEESPVDTMADQRTMAELLRAPTEGYAEAIMVPPILVNQQTSVVTTAMTAILKQFQATPPPASVKAVEEICVTCGGAHPYYQDPLRPNIPYPSRMLKQKQQEKDEVQIHKFWQMFKQLHINITLADALILMPKYQKILKDLLSNKEKLQELANTPLNENCSAVILKKLPDKLRDPGKFLIPCGFNELKCKALADLTVGINLMPLSVWKKLGLHELISTRMTLELANRAICTPAGIARDSPPYRGKTFLRTARALIDDHGEEMILHDGDERLTLNMRHDTLSYSHQPQKESINLINVFNNSSEDFLEDLFSTNQPSGNPTFSSHPELTSSEVKDDIFDPEGDNFDVESDLKEIEFLLHHNIDSSLKDSIDQSNLVNLADNLVDSMPEMFTDKHALDCSSPMIFDEYDDDLFEVESDTENVYDDPFDSKVDALPLTNNEDKKMLKALISNKEKLQKLENTPLNENYSAVILKKLPEKLGDPGKFLIMCGFNELKCKALADLADFVIVDYESDPRVPFILGRPFLRTTRALIDVH
uniref:Reverse transcriptase domain-containing protein n=1 Tax=Tanacetum cinerariifolium TaxID=118510 RepID=A0A6L2LAZ3_TANCI|nr:reverse transcriptase domain-containing protein [Tanacetum cinerariifolium]